MNNDLALAGKTKLKKMLVIVAVFTSLFADFTDFSFIYYFSWGGPKVMSSMELIDRFFQNFRFFHLNFKKIEKRGKSKFLKVFESF